MPECIRCEVAGFNKIETAVVMVATRVILLGLTVIREVGIEMFRAMRVDVVRGVGKRLALFCMHIGQHQKIAEEQCDKREKRHD